MGYLHIHSILIFRTDCAKIFENLVPCLTPPVSFRSRTPMRTCVLVLALCAAVAQAQRGYDPASQRYQEEVRCVSSTRPITARF